MGGFSTLGGGTSWQEIKQKLESEGAKNKAYDIDNDGLVENIRFKEAVELPDTPRDYEVILYKDAVRLYDPNKGKWALLRYLFGYDEFDNNGGGAWTKYINIPITTSPSEYAQYKIVIDATNVTVYLADGTQKAQGAVASDFWANVKSDGSDIRVFDQAKSQLYFWIEEWDYTNKNAVIWVRLEAGSSELNIAYGNPSATKSDYEDGGQVFEFFDDFSTNTLGTVWTAERTDGTATIEEDGTLHVVSTGKGSLTRYYADLGKTLNDFVLSYDLMYLQKSSDGDSGAFGLRQDADNRVNGNYRWEYDEQRAQIHNVIGGTFYRHNISYSFNTNEWHNVKLVKAGGNYKLYIDDVLQVDVSPSEGVPSSFAEIYFVVWQSEVKMDNIMVLKLADPADFDTPQILEF